MLNRKVVLVVTASSDPLSVNSTTGRHHNELSPGCGISSGNDGRLHNPGGESNVYQPAGRESIDSGSGEIHRIRIV